MKNTALRNALVTLVSFIFVVTVVGAWTAPGGAPPTNNVSAPITVNATDQEKFGGLWLASLAVSGRAISTSTRDADPGNTLVTKDYVDGKVNLPSNCTAVQTDANGKLTCAPVLTKSCNDILIKNPGSTSGTYTINPGGTDFDVYCDMTLETGKAWTRLNKKLAEHIGYDKTMPYYYYNVAGGEFLSYAVIDVSSEIYYSISQADPTEWRGGYLTPDKITAVKQIVPGRCDDPTRMFNNSFFCNGTSGSANIKTKIVSYTSTVGKKILRPDPTQSGKVVESTIPTNLHEWYSCSYNAGNRVTCWDGGVCSHCGGGVERDATNPRTFNAAEVYVLNVP